MWLRGFVNSTEAMLYGDVHQESLAQDLGPSGEQNSSLAAASFFGAT